MTVEGRPVLNETTAIQTHLGGSLKPETCKCFCA